MGAIRNPRKAFNFIVEIKGQSVIPPFGVQKVTGADSEVEADEHGVGNTVINTAGLVKAGTLKFDRIISLDNLATTLLESEFILLWQKLAQDGYSQSGSNDDVYKKDVIIKEIGNSGFGIGTDPIVVGITTCIGCWPTLVNGREYTRGQSGNLVETFELKVDYIVPGNPE